MCLITLCCICVRLLCIAELLRVYIADRCVCCWLHQVRRSVLQGDEDQHPRRLHHSTEEVSFPYLIIYCFIPTNKIHPCPISGSVSLLSSLLLIPGSPFNPRIMLPVHLCTLTHPFNLCPATYPSFLSYCSPFIASLLFDPVIFPLLILAIMPKSFFNLTPLPKLLPICSSLVHHFFIFLTRVSFLTFLALFIDAQMSALSSQPPTRHPASPILHCFNRGRVHVSFVTFLTPHLCSSTLLSHLHIPFHIFHSFILSTRVSCF